MGVLGLFSPAVSSLKRWLQSPHAQDLEPDCLGPNRTSATYLLCFIGKVVNLPVPQVYPENGGHNINVLQAVIERTVLVKAVHA